jgi:hypothetical protein
MTRSATTSPGRSDVALIDAGDGCEVLPLLEFAGDVGRRRGLTVHVRHRPDLPECGGIVAVRSDGSAWVLLRDVDERVWAHELAHLVDDLDGRVTERTDRTVRRRETFADRLGELLLDRRPTTVASARPLIAEARRRG